MLNHIKRNWIFLLIVLILLLLNIWVWVISDTKKEIKPDGDFVETRKIVLMK